MAETLSILEPFRHLPMFHMLTIEEGADIIQACETHRFPAGHVLFRQGDEGAGVYMIERGTIEIHLETDHGRERLAKFGTGDVLGELSLIDRGPRSATAIVTEDVELYELSAARFDELRDAMHPGAYKIVRELTRTVCARLRIVNARIEEALSQQDVPAAAPTPPPPPTPAESSGFFRRILRSIFGSGANA